MLLHITDPLRALYAIRSITTENALIATSIDASRWRRRTPEPSSMAKWMVRPSGRRTWHASNDGHSPPDYAGRSGLGVPSPNRRRTVRPAPRSHSSLGEVVHKPVGGALRKPDGVYAGARSSFQTGGCGWMPTVSSDRPLRATDHRKSDQASSMMSRRRPRIGRETKNCKALQRGRSSVVRAGDS